MEAGFVGSADAAEGIGSGGAIREGEGSTLGCLAEAAEEAGFAARAATLPLEALRAPTFFLGAAFLAGLRFATSFFFAFGREAVLFPADFFFEAGARFALRAFDAGFLALFFFFMAIDPPPMP